MLRTRDLGDLVSVSIPDDLLMPGSSASSLTLEARFFPRAYKVDTGSYPIISLAQSWDTRLELRDDKSANNPRIWIGSRELVTSQTWATAAPLGAWHRLRLLVAGDGPAEIYLNERLIGARSSSMNYLLTSDWILTLGNFDGDIEQVRITRKAGTSTFKPVTVDADPPNGPIELLANYPNPFNPETTIRYQLSEPVWVRLEIFNALGQQIHTLVDAEQASGIHHVRWDGREAWGNQVGAGVYLYRLTAGPVMATQKMFLVK